MGILQVSLRANPILLFEQTAPSLSSGQGECGQSLGHFFMGNRFQLLTLASPPS